MLAWIFDLTAWHSAVAACYKDYTDAEYSCFVCHRMIMILLAYAAKLYQQNQVHGAWSSLHVAWTASMLMIVSLSTIIGMFLTYQQDA